jgi:hypothetical protein
VPGEGKFCSVIRAVCTDLSGPVQNHDLLSCDGDFLRSFREQMRGFHDDLLGQKPSPLFTFLGWSSISVTSLMMRSMYQRLVERMRRHKLIY